MYEVKHFEIPIREGDIVLLVSRKGNVDCVECPDSMLIEEIPPTWDTFDEAVAWVKVQHEEMDKSDAGELGG